MTNVLITGAGGFIGSHLTEYLVKKGYDVKAFVFYNSFNSWGWLDTLSKDVKDNIDVFEGDIRDPYGVKKAMEECQIIYHLAALISIPYSYHSPETYVDTNIKGTLNVLQAAKELGVDKVVHTSTSEVYGTAQYVPINEKHPLQGQSPYAASKIGADQLALSFYRSFNIPVAVIRPFNTYGPRQSARAVIPSIITQISSGKSTIRLGNLNSTRDFNFVHDTVRGFEAVAESENAIGEVINIGNNYEISIDDTVRAIACIMSKNFIVEVDAARLRPEKSEVDRLWADNSKAKELTGWEPSFQGLPGFKRGLEKTIDWFSHGENLGWYKADRYNI